MIKRPYENESKTLIQAIKTMSEKPENLDNFESYLSIHLGEWLKRWASTPEGIASEFKNFAEIEI